MIYEIKSTSNVVIGKINNEPVAELYNGQLLIEISGDFNDDIQVLECDSELDISFIGNSKYFVLPLKDAEQFKETRVLNIERLYLNPETYEHVIDSDSLDNIPFSEKSFTISDQN